LGSVCSVVSVAIHSERGVCRDGQAFFLTGRPSPEIPDEPFDCLAGC